MAYRLALCTTFAALVAVACGSTECDDAADKLEECGVSAPIVSGECDETSACEAECINTHSCEEINAALSGTPNAYSDCDDACN